MDTLDIVCVGRTDKEVEWVKHLSPMGLPKFNGYPIDYSCFVGKEVDFNGYDKEYLAYYERVENSAAGTLLNSIRAKRVLDALRDIPQYPGRASLFDIGCGTGSFLSFISDADMAPLIEHSYGVDLNLDLLWDAAINRPWLRLMSPDVFLKGRSGNTPQPKGEPCICTFWDSLEHMENPLDFLARSCPDIVVISMPNLQAWYAACGGREEGFARLSEWKHNKPGEHYWLMTPDGLKAVLQAMKYEIIGDVTFEENEVRIDPLLGPKNIMTIAARRI